MKIRAAPLFEANIRKDVPKKYHNLPLQWRTKALRPIEDISNRRIIVPLELLVMFLFSKLFVYVDT